MANPPTAADPEPDTRRWVLYKRDSCPYCAKVFAALKELGQQIPMRDIGTDAGAREQLLAIGGKAQVPCLVIDQKAMYESDAIIAFLRQRLTGRGS